jgi:Zinc finger, C3HC4 type (RING finger)
MVVEHSDTIPKYLDIKSDPKKALGLKRYSLWKVKKAPAEESLQCQVCFTAYPDSIFMNCGHGGICYECAMSIWQSSNNCYLCRDEVKYILQIEGDSKPGARRLGQTYLRVVASTVVVEDESESIQGSEVE